MVKGVWKNIYISEAKAVVFGKVDCKARKCGHDGMTIALIAHTDQKYDVLLDMSSSIYLFQISIWCFLKAHNSLNIE